MIDVAKLVAGREDYYLREIADSRGDYYAGHGEAQGRWFGAKAHAMGFHGVAADGTEPGNEVFRRVFHGRDPETGRLLGDKHRQHGVHAYDLVFRPVKSVSLLYGLGSLEVAAKTRETHHAGVEAALAYLDQHVGARRGRDGRVKVAGDGLLAMGFDHRTSRATDPLLHTHLVVANRIQSPSDGRWTAIDGKTLYAHLMAAQAIHRATIQHELSRTMGVGWTRADAYGNREIEGIPPEVIKQFSKRREEIELKLEARKAEGLSAGRAAADLIAHKDRQGKEHGAAEASLRERWAAGLETAGAELAGQTRGILAAAHRGLSRRREVGVTREEITDAFGYLAGPEGLTRDASTFSRAEVIQRLGDQLAAASPGDLEDLAGEFLADPDQQRVLPVVSAVSREEDRRWTTPEVKHLEDRMLTAATAGATAERGILPSAMVQAAVDRAAKAGRPLGEDQEAALRGVLGDGQVVSPVRGRAGTGKTTLADSIRHAYQQAGFEVVGVAPTGAAAQQLGRDTGILTATIDRALREHTRAAPLFSDRTVVLVDEAGMAGTRKLSPLVTRAVAAGAKLVVIGDERQLQSVEAGGGFQALASRLGAYELQVNRRQRDPVDQHAAELIRDGLGDEALAVYEQAGRVHRVGETLAETDRAMVGAWWESFRTGEDAGMFAPRRREVDQLNTLAQQLMRDDGRLGPDAMTIQERQFRVGDRVVCGLNALNPNSRRYLGVANGTKAQVTALDSVRGEVRIRLEADQTEVTLPGWYLNRDLGGHRRPLDHAYATTVHTSQGATYDRGFGRFGQEFTREMGYVAATRARQRLDVFLVGEARPAREDPDADVPAGPASLPGDRARTPEQTAAAALSRADAQVLAIDARRPGAPVQSRSTRELREEAEQLDGAVLNLRPKSRQVEAARLARELAEAEARVAQAGAAAPSRAARGGQAPADAAARQATLPLLRQHAERLAGRVREAERHERQRAVWETQHAPELARHRAVKEELGWRTRQAGRAAEVALPQHLQDFLGPRPESVRGQRRWRQLAGQVTEYRERYGVTDPDRALGRLLRGEEASLTQRQAHRQLREQAERLWAAQRDRGLYARGNQRGQQALAVVGQSTPPQPAARVARRLARGLPDRESRGRSR